MRILRSIQPMHYCTNNTLPNSLTTWVELFVCDVWLWALNLLLFPCLPTTCSHLFKYTLCLFSAAETPACSSLRLCFTVPQAEAHAESLTQRDDRALLTEASTSQQSLLSQPVLPDVPVITGVEESGGEAGEQEYKDELEFPHDLLPSLDFSSELNIWESSLGWVEGSHTHTNTIMQVITITVYLVKSRLNREMASQKVERRVLAWLFSIFPSSFFLWAMGSYMNPQFPDAVRTILVILHEKFLYLAFCPCLTGFEVDWAQ